MFETFPIPKLLEIVKVFITYPEGRGVTEKSDHKLFTRQCVCKG